ncbi:hypothetical protein DH2020_010116 [Rehmannia glutinosa]|uniref:Protein kinase domain-containing protein n=1 Tax=Rehmannia glutinosa TaxID=99300 RepID=A0ABR0X925_REHGL
MDKSAHKSGSTTVIKKKKMSAIYDNWERLVAAVLKKEQLWQLFHDHSRSPSVLSEASDFSSSFDLGSPLHDLAFDFARLGSSSTYYRRAPSKLVLISDFSPAIDVEDVGLASAEVLGTGTFGSAYTAAMEDGVKIVVKRLKSVNISEPEFKRHMEIIGNVRHENMAALRAYYSSNDERLMMYDYYINGSVSALLHGQNGKTPALVNWDTRLTIAVGAARGIAEVHTQNGGKLVHGNIKSSNIFLNSQRYGCVSDLGLTSMISAKYMPTARCYAPEVETTQDATQASDVYSFGILLLELLTRKPPVPVPGGPQAVDLVKLVNSAKNKEMTTKVFDADLLKFPSIREHMINMLQIGISCVAKSPKKRPKMPEVVKMLEDLWAANTRNSVSLERKLVFVDNSILTFDLEDMLSSSAEVLGKGSFGSSYRAIFDNGNSIAVKRFKHVNVSFKEFRQHMDVIGRLRHENVAELRAYYFSRDEVLLVYDYQYQDNVSALLHGNKGSGRRPLDWETRLKIAMGAARGIAHIHRQDDGNLVHGNIKSSNIFLNRQQYGLVSDVGLAKVSSPIRRSAMLTPGYCAPEVKDTRNVSHASDVYSFGVVLLELVSGKPSEQKTDDGSVNSLVNWIQHVTEVFEVFDVELLRYHNKMESMWQLLQLAMDCVVNMPERRPKMPRVVKMLEDISGIVTGGQTSVGSRLEDIQPSIGSTLEDVLEDLLPRLTT